MKIFTSLEPIPPMKEAVAELLKEVKRKEPPYVRVTREGPYGKKREGKILVCGMGGSILGTRAVAELLGVEDSFCFVDNLDGKTLTRARDLASSGRVEAVFISKSGSTLETLKMVELLEPVLRSSLGKEWREHTFVVTAFPQGKLGAWAKERGVSMVMMPEDLSGRFSFFSAVGILPLDLAGMDTVSLLQGAKKAWEKPDIEILTKLFYAFFTFAVRPLVLFTYGAHLEGFALWFQQLWAESLGKKVFAQLPMVAKGSRDQHSILQMLLDVPFSGLPVFLSGPEPYPVAFPEDEKNTNDYLEAFVKGVRDAFWEKNQPALHLSLESITPEYAGSLLMHFMVLTHMAGMFLKVATFEQPAVELAKRLTRQYLSS